MRKIPRLQFLSSIISALALSACATSVTESSHVDFTKVINSQNNSYTNADFVYFLPRTLIQVELTPADMKLALTETTIRDEGAAFAVRKERAFENQGSLTLSELPGGVRANASPPYDSTGIIQHISFTTTDNSAEGPKLTATSQALLAQIATLEAKLKKQNTEGDKEKSGSEKSASSASGQGTSASFLDGARAVLVQEKQKSEANGDNEKKTKPGPVISAYCTDSKIFSAQGCVLTSSDGLHTVNLKAQQAELAAGLPGDISASSTGCSRRAVCFRRKISVPVTINIRTCKAKEGDKTPPENGVKNLAAYVEKTEKKEDCMNVAGSQILDMFDRRVNYAVELKGKRFVGVTTTVTLEDGEVVTFTDTRPSALNSIAKAPYNLVTDVVGATITLIIAVIP